MTEKFTHGYALLIGVGESAYSKLSLPVTVKDTQQEQVDWQVVKEQHKTIMVFANPGMGKSTLLRMEAILYERNYSFIRRAW